MQIEKVQMSLFKGMCALTGMANKLIEQRLGCPPGLLMLEIQGTTYFPQVMDEDIVRPEG